MPTTTTTALAAGMGMATKPKGKKKGGKKDKKKSTSPPYDVSAALIKNEKLYEELMAESTKALMNDDDDHYGGIDLTTEYIIAARAKPDNNGSSQFVGASDWVPVAQLCIVRSISQDDNKDDDHESVMESTLTAAVSYFCREINYLGCLSAPSAFKSLPRNNVEYGIEPIESFMKHVYEDVIEGKNNNNGSSSGSSNGNSSTSNGMSKAQAREILELDAGVTDAALIKTAYKKQSFKYHPDRISEEDRETLSERFYEIKQAYETLNSGVRNKDANGSQQSWYASLGGRDRNDFLGPISLLSMEKAGALCNKAFKSAVVGIDPDLTMAFVARNQSAARL